MGKERGRREDRRGHGTGGRGRWRKRGQGRSTANDRRGGRGRDEPGEGKAQVPGSLAKGEEGHICLGKHDRLLYTDTQTGRDFGCNARGDETTGQRGRCQTLEPHRHRLAQSAVRLNRDREYIIPVKRMFVFLGLLRRSATDRSSGGVSVNMGRAGTNVEKKALNTRRPMNYQVQNGIGSSFCLFLGLPRSSGTSRSMSTSAPASLRTLATALAAALCGRIRPGPSLQSSRWGRSSLSEQHSSLFLLARQQVVPLAMEKESRRSWVMRR